MVSSLDFQSLARQRLNEARHLQAGGFFDGALYLGGYAVEFALKWKLCSLLKLNHYPDKKHFACLYTHNLSSLKTLIQSAADWEGDLNFAILFNSVQRWSPERRYRIESNQTLDHTVNFLDSVEQILTYCDI